MWDQRFKLQENSVNVLDLLLGILDVTPANHSVGSELVDLC
jgi:hypothetical protein